MLRSRPAERGKPSPWKCWKAHGTGRTLHRTGGAESPCRVCSRITPSLLATANRGIVDPALMSKEGKHHYIPVFYLRRWTGRDGKLCEFSRPYRLVKPRRVHPDGTAYVHGLNTVHGFPPESAQYVEKEVLQKLDDRAATALGLMIAVPHQVDALKLDVKAVWAQFLISLAARSPEILAKMQAELDVKAGKLAEKHDISPVDYKQRVPLHSSAIPSFFIRPRRSEPRLCFG